MQPRTTSSANGTCVIKTSLVAINGSEECHADIYDNNEDARGASRATIQQLATTLSSAHSHSISTTPAAFVSLLNEIPGSNLCSCSFCGRGRRYGAGSYGKVYLGMEEHTGQLVAMKVMPLPDDPSEVEKIENEVSIMRTVHDENLVDLYDYCIVKSRYIVLVMECIVAGSLSSMLTTVRSIV